MRYEIKIGESIGEIKLGIPREKVQVMFDDLKEQIEKPYSEKDSKVEFIDYHTINDKDVLKYIKSAIK